MSLFRQREEKNIDRRASLAGIPVLSPAAVVLADGDGAARIKLPAGAVRRRWLDRFRPVVREKTYELDEFGAFVVNRMDGSKDVLSIVDEFEKRFGLSRREAELGVVAFIKMLIRRGIVSVVVAA